MTQWDILQRLQTIRAAIVVEQERSSAEGALRLARIGALVHDLERDVQGPDVETARTWRSDVEEDR